MNQELVRGYKNFLISSIKAYYLGSHIIQDEVDFFTNKQLKDGLVFFLIAFDKLDSKIWKALHLENEEEFRKYVDLSVNSAVLTLQGEELKNYLEEKFKIHVSMLEFNGIKPQYIARVTTMLKRFEKFWLNIVNFSKKKRL